MTEPTGTKTKVSEAEALWAATDQGVRLTELTSEEREIKEAPLPPQSTAAGLRDTG